MRTYPWLAALLLPVFWVFSFSAQAEQQQTFENTEVHYNAFNSTFLDPKVAEQYGLTRSRQYGVLNIAVLDTGKPGKPAMKAMVKTELKNLIGQVQDLKFQEVTEGEAIYYISNFRFTDDEVLNFEISVQPDPNKPPHVITFSQRFYMDQ